MLRSYEVELTELLLDGMDGMGSLEPVSITLCLCDLPNKPFVHEFETGKRLWKKRKKGAAGPGATRAQSIGLEPIGKVRTEALRLAPPPAAGRIGLSRWPPSTLATKPVSASEGTRAGGAPWACVAAELAEPDPRERCPALVIERTRASFAAGRHGPSVPPSWDLGPDTPRKRGPPPAK